MRALIDTPEDMPRAYGVFAPCFTCIKESHGAAKICRALAERGIAMMRFDMTGLGESDGIFAHTNFSTRVQDIIAAVEAVARNYAPPTLLVGHSISGTAVLTAQKSLPDIPLFATIGSPQDPPSTIEKFRRTGQINEAGDMDVIDVLGTPYTVDKNFVPDLLSQQTAQHTTQITGNLLVFHAPNDAVVSFDNAQTIASRAGESAELIPMSDTATHLFERGTDDAVFVAETIHDRLLKVISDRR